MTKTKTKTYLFRFDDVMSIAWLDGDMMRCEGDPRFIFGTMQKSGYPLLTFLLKKTNTFVVFELVDDNKENDVDGLCAIEIIRTV